MAERSEFHYRLACGLGKTAVGALYSTVRYRREGEQYWKDLRAQGKQVIYVFWHARLLSLVTDRKDEGNAVLISLHSDGEYIARVIDAYGFKSVRGSSTRGGSQGARNLLKASKEGRDLVVTPDGPKGPPRVMKDGAIFLARLTGLPIVPVGVSVDRAWRASSWDRFMVAKPFSTVYVEYGEPIHVPRDLDEDGVEVWRERVEGRLNDLTDKMDRAAGRTVGEDR